MSFVAATTAQATWKQDGSLLSDLPGGMVASDGNGGVFAAAGGYPRRFARLYQLTADGDTASGWVTRGLELTPHAVITEHNSITAIAALSDGVGGSYFLTAEQFGYQGSGGFLYEVEYFLHRRTASGEVAEGWDEAGVLLETPYIDHRFELNRLPRMVSDGRQGVLVAWLDGVSGRPNPSVLVQRVSPEGRVQWGGDGIVVRHGANACTIPALVADETGGALVFWGEWNPGGTSIQVRGQHVMPAGDLAWGADGRAISTGSYDRMAAAIPADGGWVWANYAPAISGTSDGHGGAIIGWAGSQGVDLNILAIRVASKGWLSWEREVVICSAPGEQASVVSTEGRDGGAVFAWRDGRAGDDVGVFAQAVTAAGRTRWTRDGVAVCLGAGNRGPVALSSDGRDGVYLVWTDPRDGGHVLGARLQASGQRAPEWSVNGELVSRTAQPGDGSVGLQLIRSARGFAVAAWTDARVGSLAMLLTPDGPASPASGPAPNSPSGQGVAASTMNPTAVFSLLGVSPNPVSDNGVIRFALATATPASLEVVDVAGRRVWSREVGRLGPGEHSVSLMDGARLTTGVYFVRLTQGERVASVRTTFLR
jgi:hypothetical protein